MRDARGVFRSWLLSLGGVTALVGNRVFCDPLPDKTAFPALSYVVQSEPAAEGVPLQEVAATVFCWGTSEQGVRDLYGALVGEIQAPGAHEARIGADVMSGINLDGMEMTKRSQTDEGVWYLTCRINFAMDL